MTTGLVWHFTTAVLLGGTLVCSSGCASSGAAGSSEPEARKALAHALDAWKSGRKAEDLRQESPEVIVGDPDWKSGLRLSDYEIGSGLFDGKNLHVLVTLTIEQPRRGKRKLVVHYIVGTRPVVTLFRDGE